MWQKCPICEGKSVTEPLLVIQSLSLRCACNNTGIINTKTGRPPEPKGDPIKQKDFIKIGKKT